VRQSAAWSLSYRKVSPETMQTMMAKLASEPEASVATKLLDAIWARRASDRDRVVAAVEAVSRQHGTEAVRERAKQLLASAT
jgi:hypothetical protein